MPSMIIERIGSCNDCGLCSEKRVVLPGLLVCSIGLAPGVAIASSAYRICTIRFRIKSWDFPYDIPDVDIVGMKFANLITISSADRDSWPDEITIERQGVCSKCGHCCGYKNSDIQECSHVVTTGGNKGECSIYSTLNDYCSEHDGNHEMCVSQCVPYRIYNSACEYRFIITTPGIPITGNEIVKFYFVQSGHDIGAGAFCYDRPRGLMG